MSSESLRVCWRQDASRQPRVEAFSPSVKTPCSPYLWPRLQHQLPSRRPSRHRQGKHRSPKLKQS